MKFKFVLFSFLMAHGQDAHRSLKDTLRPHRVSYEEHNETDCTKSVRRTIPMLSAEHYPWGVCHSYYDDFSIEERQWTKEAIQKWNTEFSNYRWNKFKTHDVANIPKGDLFVESCDRNKHNIIYTKKYNAKEGEQLAYYALYNSSNDWQYFLYFDGFIVFASNAEWTKAFFINIMIHELSHALGIPHAKPYESTFMSNIEEGFMCDDYRNKVCEFKEREDGTIFEFETFIEKLMTKSEHEGLTTLKEETPKELINECISEDTSP